MEYNFNDIERKWQKYWKENQTYRTENGGDKPKYYVLDMFPYPSGAGLHVGHPLGYIASDIVARYKRLKGYNVLHPMGYDAFGLPAEQYAIQTGRHPADTTKENIARYREQLDKIGFSFDWSREVQTCDPKYYKWTQWIFVQLFKSWYNCKTQKAESIDTLIALFESEGFNGTTHRVLTGDIEHDVKPFTAAAWKNFSEKEKSDVLMNFRLAYLGEAWVNWCPALGTVLANDEVKDGVSERGGYPVERKRMPQWSMRITAYADRLLNDLNGLDWSDSIKEAQRNWIGKSEGSSILFSVHGSPLTVEVFTTRPDTIFGVTFVTLAPEHELVDKITTAEYKDAVDAYVNVAKNKSERERQAEKKVSGQFTGAYVIHPFTNAKVPVYIGEYVLAGYGTGAVMAVPAHDSRDFAFAKHFNLGIPQVVTAPADHDFSKESYDAKEGKLINSDFLNGLDVKDAVRRAIDEIEKRGMGQGKVNYRLRDAAFGRQRYWGEPIPVYYKTVPSSTSASLSLTTELIPEVMDESDLPLILPEVDKFLPTESGEPPLARAKDWTYTPPNERTNSTHASAQDGGEELKRTNSTHASPQDGGEELKRTNSTHALPQDGGEELKRTNSTHASPQDGGEELKRTNSTHASPQPLSGGEGLSESEEDLIVEEAARHYKTANKDGWAKLKNMARENRTKLTAAEELLWERLRNNKIGHKIRRQHPIDFFIADFICIRARVIIEVDGGYHTDADQRAYDEHRTFVLNEMGFKVIRFTNEEVLKSADDVVSRITNVLDSEREAALSFGELGEARAAGGKYPLETTTMPGWAGSSWYFLRYMDPQNDKELVSKEVADYWKNVDLYLGGAEHATGHLLYVRFWTKFLYDIGKISVNEPAQKLVNQGMIVGESAFTQTFTMPVLVITPHGKTAAQLNRVPTVFVTKSIAELIEKEDKATMDFFLDYYDEKVIKSNPANRELKRDIDYKLRYDEFNLDNCIVKTRTDIQFVGAGDVLNVETYLQWRDSWPALKGVSELRDFITEPDGRYICSREVEKMSKSKLNVVSPDDICTDFGADTLRLYEMFLGPLEQHKPWSTNGISGTHNFLKRFFRLFAEISNDAPAEAELKVLHRTLKKVADDIERMSFNTCVSTFMIAVNELNDLKCNKRAILEPLVIALSPFAPHAAEELWSVLGNKDSVTKASFPVVDEKYLVDNTVNYPVQFNGKMRFTIALAADMKPADVEKEVLASAEAQKYLEGKAPKKVIVVPKKIVNVVM